MRVLLYIYYFHIFIEIIQNKNINNKFKNITSYKCTSQIIGKILKQVSQIKY